MLERRPRNSPVSRCEKQEAMDVQQEAPSSSEEGVGGGGVSRHLLLKRAAEMRNNPTEPENRMWMQLKGKRFSGYKFRRQSVIEKRIVDFFCPAKGLVLEIDGDTHDASLDARRDARMEREKGYHTVRVTNRDVVSNMEGVLIVLERALNDCGDRWRARNHPLTPSFEKEGGNDRSRSR